MADKKRRDFLDAFADYYYEKNGRDKDKTITEIQNLGISQIEVCYKNCYIWTSRPGLFIGNRGKNYENLRNYIQEKLGIPAFEIKIFEKDSIVDEIVWGLEQEELAEELTKEFMNDYVAAFDENDYDDYQ